MRNSFKQKYCPISINDLMVRIDKSLSPTSETFSDASSPKLLVGFIRSSNLHLLTRHHLDRSNTREEDIGRGDTVHVSPITCPGHVAAIFLTQSPPQTHLKTFQFCQLIVTVVTTLSPVIVLSLIKHIHLDTGAGQLGPHSPHTMARGSGQVVS